MQVIAPVCPDCGSVCVHPFTVPVACTACGGTGKVQPPPPTDEQIGVAENRWTCLGGRIEDFGDSRIIPRNCSGRSDIVAHPSLWAEVKRTWRTRTKTTVLDAHEVRRGKWTITVTFEPDDPERT